MKLEVYEMKAYSTKANIDVILSGVLKGRGIEPRQEVGTQSSAPSYWLSHWSKSLYVAKKWWGVRPLNSDCTSNIISSQWENHFKGLCDTKKIIHSMLKMVDNHLQILLSHHILKHRGHNFPCFDYEEKLISDRIKLDDGTRKNQMLFSWIKLTKIPRQ